MKFSLVPGICGLALASMVAVGGHHWWDVHQQVAAWHASHDTPSFRGQPSSGGSLADSPDSSNPAAREFLQELRSLRQENQNLRDEMAETNRKLGAARQGGRETPPSPVPSAVRETPKAVASTLNPPNTSSAPAKEFFQGMLDELRALKQENKDLRDQVAETNRDLMEVQFRLDTHSQEFRPLKLKNDDSIGDPTADRPIATQPRDAESGVLPPRAIVPGLELPQ